VKPKGERPRADTIFIDGAASTLLEDINESLIASGQWVDSTGNIHAFTLDLPHGRARTDLNPQDGSPSQQAWGINDAGLVAVSTDLGMSYIYCPQENPYECPAVATMTANRSPQSGNAVSDKDGPARTALP
jgi:hypothetical protein